MMKRQEKKRGPGRPPISGEATLQINVRLPESYLDWLGDEAEKQGWTGRTAVIRRLIHKEMSAQQKK